MWSPSERIAAIIEDFGDFAMPVSFELRLYCPLREPNLSSALKGKHLERESGIRGFCSAVGLVAVAICRVPRSGNSNTRAHDPSFWRSKIHRLPTSNRPSHKPFQSLQPKCPEKRGRSSPVGLESLEHGLYIPVAITQFTFS